MVLAMSAAAVVPCYAQRSSAHWAQSHQDNKPSQPPKPPKQQPRPPQNQADRHSNGNPNRPPESNANHAGTDARPNYNSNRPPSVYTPPPRKEFNDLSPQEKQKVLEYNRRLQKLPPAQRQELQERAQVWSKLTPAQKNHIRNDVLPKWRQMPQDRRQAIRQRLRVLQNMPESARNERLNDPNFTRGMTEEDKATLRDLSHLHVGGAPDPPSE